MFRKRSAFTLVDLLIVIAILAVLVSVLIVVVPKAREAGATDYLLCKGANAALSANGNAVPPQARASLTSVYRVPVLKSAAV